MDVRIVEKKAFSVLGKIGSTESGDSFIKQLWNDANSNFNEIATFAKKDNDDNIVGIWGLMSDFSKSLKPWEDNFTKGLYLAGVEVNNDCEEIPGWEKWDVPSLTYIVVKGNDINVFNNTLKYIEENNFKLVSAVFDYTDPKTNENYMYFPIKKL